LTKRLVLSENISHKAGFRRIQALIVLAEGWRDNPEVLPLLKQRAVHDDSPGTNSDLDWTSLYSYVRLNAIEGIARFWPAHPDTVPFLRERAENDPTEWLREWTKDLLDEIEDSE
jgi:hypothetical protein